MTTAQLSTGVILQVTMIVTFISIFFFIYASRIEEQIVKTQIDRLVTSFTQDATILMSPDEKKTLQTYMNKLQPPTDLDKEDKEAEENNKQLINKTIILIGALFFCGIVITVILCMHYNLDSWSIFKNAFFGVCACILTEYIFLTYFAANYRSLDPNTVKRSVIDSLQNYANS